MAKLTILLLVVTISAALAGRENETFSATCLKVARDQNDRGGKTANSVMSGRRGLVGGWGGGAAKRWTWTHWTTRLLKYLQVSLSWLSSGRTEPANTIGGDVRCFTEGGGHGSVRSAVNGMNYYIQFEANPKNGNGSVKECVAEAYVSFGFLYHGIPEQPTVKVNCGVK